MKILEQTHEITVNQLSKMMAIAAGREVNKMNSRAADVFVRENWTHYIPSAERFVEKEFLNNLDTI